VCGGGSGGVWLFLAGDDAINWAAERDSQRRRDQKSAALCVFFASRDEMRARRLMTIIHLVL
jgi:hypothetical protein